MEDLQLYTALQLGEAYDLIQDKIWCIEQVIKEAKQNDEEIHEDVTYALKLLKQTLKILD